MLRRLWWARRPSCFLCRRALALRGTLRTVAREGGGKTLFFSSAGLELCSCAYAGLGLTTPYVVIITAAIMHALQHGCVRLFIRTFFGERQDLTGRMTEGNQGEGTYLVALVLRDEQLRPRHNARQSCVA